MSKQIKSVLNTFCPYCDSGSVIGGRCSKCGTGVGSVHLIPRPAFSCPEEEVKWDAERRVKKAQLALSYRNRIS